MKVLACGSRSWTNVDAIRARIYRLPADAIVMHGDAPGVDRMAALAAEEHGLAVKAFPADWKRHGRRAGFLRNLVMLDQEPDLVLAWWDGTSRGTEHTIREAARRGIPVEVA